MMVETDASDHAIAGILLVTTKDNEICLVAFFSCSLQGVEKNYDTHDKELLAVFEAFKNWWHFLEGSAKVIDMVTNVDGEVSPPVLLVLNLTQLKSCGIRLW